MNVPRAAENSAGKSTQPHALACLEVWGGNGRIDQEVSLPGLRGWVHSRPQGGGAAGGDVYYLSVCGQGELARIAVADVTGHGEKVSQAADCLRQLIRKQIDFFDQSELARELSRSFEQMCPSGQLATAVLLGIYGRTGRLVLANGGHPPPLWYRAAAQAWQLLEEPSPDATGDLADLPLGLIPGSDYHQIAAQLDPGDLLLLYSDALSDARNQAGELLRPEGLRQLACQGARNSPRATGQSLLQAVADYRGEAAQTDDETLVVLERVGF